MFSKRMIRILCLALCLAVLMPCISALGETTKVTAYMLRLRESGSTSAKVLDAFPRGTKVTILKKGDEWTKVEVRGKTGYMKTSMLAYSRNKDSGTGTSDSNNGGNSTSSVSTGDVMYVAKGVRLNLREKASSDSDILGSYHSGTKVTILKKGNYWSRVEVKGQTGYMANEYLSSEK